MESDCVFPTGMGVLWERRDRGIYSCVFEEIALNSETCIYCYTRSRDFEGRYDANSFDGSR